MSCYICWIKGYKIAMKYDIHSKKKSRRGRFIPSVVIQRSLESGIGIGSACVGRNVYNEIRYREWLMHDGVGNFDVLMRECRVLERYL